MDIPVKSGLLFRRQKGPFSREIRFTTAQANSIENEHWKIIILYTWCTVYQIPSFYTLLVAQQNNFVIFKGKWERLVDSSDVTCAIIDVRRTRGRYVFLVWHDYRFLYIFSPCNNISRTCIFIKVVSLPLTMHLQGAVSEDYRKIYVYGVGND